MKLTRKVALEVAHHEAVIREAYKDSVGVWTWSVGLTNASGHNVERYIDNPQPMEKCIAVFMWALERYADDVREAFAGHDLSEAQFAAALSFHWNTGAIKTAAWVRKWKEGNAPGAKSAFMAWRKPAEIIPRRRAERDLFFYGKWSGDGKMTEWTKLTARKTPNWRSGVKVDVSRAIDAAISREAPSRLPEPPKPGRAPQPAPAPKRGFFARLFGRGKA